VRQSSYDHSTDGNEITVCDMNEHPPVPDGVATRLGADYLQNLGEFDLVVRSPFVHPRKIVEDNNEAILEKVTSNTNELLKLCPTKNVI
jgi:hypothetical protein